MMLGLADAGAVWALLVMDGAQANARQRTIRPVLILNDFDMFFNSLVFSFPQNPTEKYTD